MHSKDYVVGVVGGTIPNGHGNRSKAIAESCCWTAGSMACAVFDAIQNGKAAVSPSSGFHHAHYDRGQGFLHVQRLVHAAIRVFSAQTDWRVGILDCDYHYGDGTADIIRRLNLGDRIVQWSSGACDWDADNFLDALPGAIKGLGEIRVLIYQAVRTCTLTIRLAIVDE